ncbi:hypothetical protein Tsubulata_031666, partial [Turnera subulata]
IIPIFTAPSHSPSPAGLTITARRCCHLHHLNQSQPFMSIPLAPMLKHDPESRRLSSGSSPATPQKPSSTTRMCGLR